VFKTFGLHEVNHLSLACLVSLEVLGLYVYKGWTAPLKWFLFIYFLLPIKKNYFLLAYSIDSFDTFCTRFTTQFVDCKPIVTNLASLEHVVKGENESLRQYMPCFAKAYLNIFDLHTTMTIHSIKVGFRSDPFSVTLYVDPPLNMDDLRARVTSQFTKFKKEACW